MIRNRQNVRSYVTKDGSTVWELLHPGSSPSRRVSVAEAYIEQGTESAPHIHRKSQEIYYILEGSGTMRLGGEAMNIEAGDAILILPGTPHSVKAASSVRILCICSPPYSHEDTEMLEPVPEKSK